MNLEYSRPEIFIGLVGAVGSPVSSVSKSLEQAFKSVDYKPTTIRLSKLLTKKSNNSSSKTAKKLPEDERIRQAMNAGDRLRTNAGRADAVVSLGVRQVDDIREKHYEEDVPLAFIFHSLKTPEEVETLRDIYRENFFLVSAYSSKKKRLEVLKKKIGDSRDSLNYQNHTQEAEDLIERDKIGAVSIDGKEPENVLGQNVEGTFPLGDFFVNCDGKVSISNQISRFIQILFSHPNRTPTVDEYVMFHAKAAALRSADLSRQVGAVISSEFGEIISAGCNEVPTTGGGSVWEGDEDLGKKENRDFSIGYDPSVRMRDELLEEAFNKIPKDWLSPAVIKKGRDKLVNEALYAGNNSPLKGTRIASILEFGRVVHAEMTAITDAARRGNSVKDSTLYCTTFPCHMCARHIISAGIKRVVFIEPYPKSLAKELYGKNIRVDNDKEADNAALVFEPFVGVGPRRFVELFEAPTRKDKRGKALEWEPGTAEPKVQKNISHILLEQFYINETSNINV